MEKNIKVVFSAQNCVELLEEDVPEIGANEVLIETEVSQISTGTELTRLEGNVDADSIWVKGLNYPIYPGYSNVGKIIKVGEEVDKDWLGKRVLTAARHQKYVACTAGDGLIVVPDGVDSDEAVFGTLGCVAMASIRSAGIRPGDTVVVYGAGLVGQLVARLAKIAGALNVFVTDVSDYRLSMLPDDESFYKINTLKEDVVEALGKYGKKELARIVFETTSVPSLVEKEIECLQKLGRLVITSSMKGKSLVDFEYCSRKGLTIIGAHNYAMHTPVGTPYDPWTRNEDTRYFLELLNKKEISLKETITHKESYKNAIEMYQMLMKDRTQALCVLLDWKD